MKPLAEGHPAGNRQVIWHRGSPSAWSPHWPTIQVFNLHAEPASSEDSGRGLEKLGGSMWFRKAGNEGIHHGS